MTRQNRLTAGGMVLLCGLVAILARPAAAEALFTLKGKTPETQLASEADIRVSVLGWTEAAKAKAIANQYAQAADQLAAFLAKQETEGYLFTAESVGYSIKYAWQADEPDGKHMVLAIMPALKTHNPYMWKQAAPANPGYTLLDLQWQGSEALMRTSLDAPVKVDAQGRLALGADAKTRVFARLRDDTPYYLKH